MATITRFNNFMKQKFRDMGKAFSRIGKSYGLSRGQQEILKDVAFLLIFGILALLTELFGFNFRHWQSLSNKPRETQLIYEDGYVLQDDGTVMTKEGDYGILLPNLDCRVNNLCVRLINADYPDNPKPDAIDYTINARDYSHYQFYHVGKRRFYAPEERSAYMRLHLYGDAKEIRINPQIGTNLHLKVEVTLNPVVPLFFAWERFLIVFGFLTLIYYFRPASRLHGIRYLKMDKRARIAMIALFFLVNAVILYWVNTRNSFYQGEYGVNTEQYQRLAEAFKEGSLSLLYEPDERLKTMGNPYDMSYRNAIMEFDDYRFDHAYYNGKYYVYFGVVPCALFYFPYYLITGEHLSNHMVCYAGVLLILLGILLLYDRMIARYAKKCSVGLWFLTVELTVLGSYIVYVTKRPDLYSIPIIWATAFALMGMWAFLCSMPASAKEAHLSKGYLILGSVLTALVAGCRPQLMLIVIPELVLLRRYVFSWNYIKTKDGILSVLSVGIPMALIGGLLMAYNALRFGSPFDFGAFYNLTFNDMRYRGTVLDRVPVGAVYYLIRPMELVPEYPYFGNINVQTRYLGETIWETTYGGIFFASPFCLFALCHLFFRKQLQKKRTLYLLGIWCIVIALVIMAFDTINSGILARYFFNFSFLWMMSATFALWGILAGKEPAKGLLFRAIIWTLVCFLLFEILYQILTFMLDSGDYFKSNRKDLFYHYYTIFGFGL